MDLPDLGVGVIWFAGLDHMIEAGTGLVDFFEVEPATVSLSPGIEAVTRAAGPLAHLAARGKPVAVHGVSCPLGGTIPADEGEVAALAAASELVDAPWVSEHLSIDRIEDPSGQVIPTGFFLPPAQIAETVEVAAEHLRRLRDATGRPIAFETGVNYLRARPGELTDGAFFAAVAEAADCYILCDLHNLWCNQHNGRQPAREVLDELPLERICEIHLAGGQRRDGFLLDAHSNLVDPALAAFALEIVEELPALHAVTFELIPDYVAPNGIDTRAYRRQLEQLHELWEARGRRAKRTRTPTSPGLRRSESAWTPSAWESALGEALVGNHSPLGADPGIGLYRHLIATIRDGAVVTALPLSYRLMALSLGVPAADEILDRYRRITTPAAWARDEALNFGEFLRTNVTDVPHLDEILGFELAAQEAVASGRPRDVQFSCDPNALIDPLRRGVRPPEGLPAGNFKVVIDP